MEQFLKSEVCRNHQKPMKFYHKTFERVMCEMCVEELGLWSDWY